MLGNMATNTINLPMNVTQIVDPRVCYGVRVYDSERGQRETFSESDGELFEGLDRGYRTNPVPLRVRMREQSAS